MRKALNMIIEKRLVDEEVVEKLAFADKWGTFASIMRLIPDKDFMADVRKDYRQRLQSADYVSIPDSYHGGICALLLSRMAWDSEIFKIESYRMEPIGTSDAATTMAMVCEAESQVARRDGRYVLVRIPGQATELYHALEQSGYVTLDHLVTYG